MRRGTALTITLGLTLCLGLAPAGQEPAFRAVTDLVTFGVTVTDRRGAFVADLVAEDFEILEEGRRQHLQFFTQGHAAASSPPLHLGLLFDTSASMGDSIDLSRSAAIKFLNSLPEARDITLVDFDDEVRVAKYGQADFARLVERIRRRKPAGLTALYDALGVYLDGATEDSGRTVLVVYTDGGDTRSATAFSGLMDLVRASDVTIYAVGFLEQLSGSGRAEQRARLQQLTDATGGHAVFPLSMKDVEKAYARIVEEVRAQYLIGYVSTNPARDGKWRKVEVRVKGRSGGLKLSTRKGYFAAYQAGTGNR